MYKRNIAFLYARLACIVVYNVSCRTREGQSPLDLCISEGFGEIVAQLCKKGADQNSHPSSPEPPLWVALNSKQEDIASTLVQ